MRQAAGKRRGLGAAWRKAVPDQEISVLVSAKSSVFRQSALASGLITQQQLDRVADVIRREKGRDGGPVSDEELAEKLVELDVLTAYQVAQLKEGRTKFNLGPYIITDFIGQGGMGQVFKAVHDMMGRESAVKVLPLNRATPEAIVNFTREIRTQAQLDHPNLVRAFDAGYDGNVYYLVTEYVPGTDLRRLVRSRGPLNMQQAAHIIAQAARGLEHAHQRGLIHRDVKPGNILVTPEGQAKVSDLGLSGFMHLVDEDPRARKVVGTPDYLSPEQIRSPATITSVSDIYSLGCTLYYSVTGKVPFPGGSTAEKARRHLEETPWHPRRFNPDISEDFVELIADMMEKDPTKRIQTCGDVVARLEPWAIQAGPVHTQSSPKSFWMPPPLPTQNDTGGIPDEESWNADSASQWSQGTATGMLHQDTVPGSARSRQAPPLTLTYPRPPVRELNLSLALVISAISLLTGIALGFALGVWFAS